MIKINFRNICVINIEYNATDVTNGFVSSFPLPLSTDAEKIIIRMINDNEINKMIIKKIKL